MPPQRSRRLVDRESPMGKRKRFLRRIGYLLAATSDVMPSILAYTRAEWTPGARADRPFDGPSTATRWRYDEPHVGLGRMVAGHGSAAGRGPAGPRGYEADAISRAYYASLHAAKAALQVHGVGADSHAAVKRLLRAASGENRGNRGGVGGATRREPRRPPRGRLRRGDYVHRGGRARGVPAHACVCPAYPPLPAGPAFHRAQLGTLGAVPDPASTRRIAR